MAKLPRSVVRDLNAVGFVLTADEPPFTLVRTALGSELYLRLEPLPNGRWLVRLSFREPVNWGKIPNPRVPVSLAKLGEETGDGSLELETTALVSRFPRLLETCILPTIDLGPELAGTAMRQIAIFGLAVLPALAYGLLDVWGHENLPAWSAATTELPLRDRVGIATWNAGIRYAPWFVLGGVLVCPILSAALGWRMGRRPDTSGATEGVPAWGALAVASSLASAFLLQQPGIGFVATLMILEWISIVAACLCFACAYVVLSTLKALPMPAWMAFGLIAVSYWVGGLMVAVSLSVAVWTWWMMTQRRRARLDGAVIDGRRPLGG